MLGGVAPPHGETLRKASPSASRARPCGVCWAAVPAASSFCAAAALSANPPATPDVKFVSWMFCPGASSWLIAHSPSSWYWFMLAPPATIPHVVSAPLRRPSELWSSSALTRPPIEVPNT